MNRTEHGQMNLRPEGINHNRHQRRGGGDYRRQEVNKARRFVGDDVFLKNELEQIGERLKEATIADAIWSEAPLDESQYAPLSQNRVRDHRHHDREGDEDADQQKGDLLEIFHTNFSYRGRRVTERKQERAPDERRWTQSETAWL